MAFNRTDTTAQDASATGQGALNHIDMLEKARDMAINQSATVNGPSIAVAGTSGYALGDILEIADGAATEAFPTSHPLARANYEVTGVSAGQVTAVRLRNSGVYTVLPTNNGTADEFDTVILSGSGVGTVSLGGVLFASNGWSVDRETSEISTLTINAAGTGYVDTDVVTLVDGNEVVAATVDILTVGGSGEILTFALLTNGVYNVLPAVLNVVGGSGSGGAFNITAYAVITDLAVERELIMTSTAGAIVAFRTDTNVSSASFSWELHGLVSYTAVNTLEAQVNVSPGRFDSGDTSGQYIFLRDTDPLRWNWFLNITNRRIWGNFNIENAIYNFMYLGLGDAYGTIGEYAYPLVVGGCSSRMNLNVVTSAESWGGLPQAVAFDVGDNYGPAMIHTPGGGWEVIRNGVKSGNDILGIFSPFARCFPPGWYDSGDTALVPLEDQITPVSGVTDQPRVQTWEQYASVATASGAGTTSPPTDTFYPAEDGSGGEDPRLHECIVAGLEPSQLAYVELSDVRWIERTVEGDVFSAENEVYVGGLAGEVWVVFNCGALTARQHWLALKLSP